MHLFPCNTMQQAYSIAYSGSGVICNCVRSGYLTQAVCLSPWSCVSFVELMNWATAGIFRASCWETWCGNHGTCCAFFVCLFERKRCLADWQTSFIRRSTFAAVFRVLDNDRGDTALSKVQHMSTTMWWTDNWRLAGNRGRTLISNYRRRPTASTKAAIWHSSYPPCAASKQAEARSVR
jgi:hypothetical protein